MRRREIGEPLIAPKLCKRDRFCSLLSPIPSKLLPKVTKILIIGWQAREAHFTGILKSYLTGRVRMLVVSGNQEEGNKILGYFNDQIGFKASPDSGVSKGGFTDFVVNRQGDEFFKA